MLRLLLIAVLLLWSRESFAAEPEQRVGTLDLIPADAVGAIAIRNVAELTKRGDALIAKAEVKFSFRLSMGYGFVVDHLGIRKGLDPAGPAALMALKNKFDVDTFVLAVPVADVAAMAANFKLTEKDLQAGKVIDRHEREGDKGFDYVRYIALRDRHLFMGGNAALVEHTLQAKSLRDTLGESDRAALSEDDIVLYGNRQKLGDVWGDFSKELQDQLRQLEADEAHPLRKLAAAVDELHYVVGGLRLDDGVGASLVVQFEGEKSREVLTQLQGTKTAASLTGLPTGNLLAAQTLTGDGEASAVLVSALLTKLPLGDQILSSAHRPNVIGVFGEVWQRLKGSRTAVYENEHPERDGQFSFIAILETDDAERFIAEVTSLARFVNASTLTADEAAAVIDAKTIAELLAELGHEEYRVRQLATTKLGLLGAPALPAIEAATKSSDPEVKFRARALRDQINAVVADQRAELLEADLLTRIKPNFAYFPKQETRSGHTIDMVQMKLRADEGEYAPQLRRFLGPQWSKLRLTTVGKRVIVLLGSDVALFDKAVANVTASEPGLQGDERFAAFHARAQDSTAEFHLRLARSQWLVAPPPADDKAIVEDVAATTSLGIEISPQRLRVNLFAPIQELKNVAKQMHW